MAKTESETFSITVEQDVPTEMRDGVLLRSDIYRPIEAAACRCCCAAHRMTRDKRSTSRSRGRWLPTVTSLLSKISGGVVFPMGSISGNSRTTPKPSTQRTVTILLNGQRVSRQRWTGRNMGTFLPVVVHLASRRNAAAIP